MRRAFLEAVLDKLTQWLRDETGATAIEYAVVAGFIALVIVAAVRGVGTNLSPIFSNVASNMH